MADLQRADLIYIATQDEPDDSDSPSRPPLPDGWTQVKGEDRLLYTFDEKGKAVCGAYNSKRQKFCHNSPADGRNRCRFHGGASPRGIASASFKTGKFSKDVPARLASRYEDARTNPELMSLRDEIALMDARISDLLRRVDSGESGALWRKLQDTYREMLKALRAHDQEAANDLMNELGRTINRGVQDYQAWEDVSRIIDSRRKLVESQSRVQIQMQQMLTVEQAMSLIAAVVDTVRNHVKDRETLMSISKDIAKLVSKNAPQTGAGGN